MKSAAYFLALRLRFASFEADELERWRLFLIPSDLDALVDSMKMIDLQLAGARLALHSRMISTQHTLVSRLRQGAGDDDWERFYLLYERPLLAFAASHSLRESDCQDVLQETMVKMLRGGFGRFDSSKGPFTGFLFNVAKGCVVDAIRRRHRSESRHVSLQNSGPDGERKVHEQIASSNPTPYDLAERQGQMALIALTLDFLIQRRCFQPKTVAIFKAVTLEGSEPQGVARRFRTSVGNVYEAKRAVLARLRDMLQALDRGLDLEEAMNSCHP